MKKTRFLLLVGIGLIVGCVFPTPVNTSPSQPTLTSQERENYVQESLSSGSNCKLPCWWDITPGETTWQDTEELLRDLGVMFDPKGIPGYTSNAHLHGVIGFDFKSVTNDFYFEETDGVIDAILIRSHSYDEPEEFQFFWKNYSPKKILKEYGIPDRIWLNITHACNMGRGYYLWIFYDKLGFMVRYPGGF